MEPHRPDEMSAGSMPYNPTSSSFALVVKRAGPSPLATARRTRPQAQYTRPQRRGQRNRRGAVSGRATQQFGTLDRFLANPKDGEGSRRPSMAHHHIEDLRRHAEDAAAAHAAAPEGPAIKMSLGLKTAHRLAMVRNKQEHRNQGLSPMFSARRKRALRKREEQQKRHQIGLQLDFGGGTHDHSSSVFGSSNGGNVSNSSNNIHKTSPSRKAVTDHSRSIQVATAKAKLKGFARALVSSSANAKHYFAAGSKILKLAREAEAEEEEAAALLAEATAATEAREAAEATAAEADVNDIDQQIESCLEPPTLSHVESRSSFLKKIHRKNSSTINTTSVALSPPQRETKMISKLKNENKKSATATASPLTAPPQTVQTSPIQTIPTLVRPMSRQSKYIQQCEASCLLPEPLRAVLNSGMGSKPGPAAGLAAARGISVRLGHRGIGDDMAMAIAVYLAASQDVVDLDVRDNSIGQRGCTALLRSQLGKATLQRLVLSQNRHCMAPTVGSTVDAVGALEDLFGRKSGQRQRRLPIHASSPRTGPCYSLRVLDLQATGMNDAIGARVVRAISGCRSLKTLSLAQNCLGKATCRTLRKVLGGEPGAVGEGAGDGDTNALLLDPRLQKKAVRIESLNLAGNRIGGEAAVLLFEGVRVNPYLVELNLQENSLGSCPSPTKRQAGIDALCACLASDPVLRHLDVGRNHLDSKAGQKIGEALKNNKTLLGLHTDGNAFRVNAQGFVINNNVDKALDRSSHRHRDHHDTSGVESLGTKDRDAREELQRLLEGKKNCCWLCGNWRSIRLYWEHGVSGFLPSEHEHEPGDAFGNKSSTDINDTVLYLRMYSEGWPSSENWQRIAMSPLGGNRGWEVELVVPPGPLRFVFEWKQRACLATDRPRELLSAPVVTRLFVNGQSDCSQEQGFKVTADALIDPSGRAISHVHAVLAEHLASHAPTGDDAIWLPRTSHPRDVWIGMATGIRAAGEEDEKHGALAPAPPQGSSKANTQSNLRKRADMYVTGYFETSLRIFVHQQLQDAVRSHKGRLFSQSGQPAQDQTTLTGGKTKRKSMKGLYSKHNKELRRLSSAAQSTRSSTAARMVDDESFSSLSKVVVAAKSQEAIDVRPLQAWFADRVSLLHHVFVHFSAPHPRLELGAYDFMIRKSGLAQTLDHQNLVEMNARILNRDDDDTKGKTSQSDLLVHMNRAIQSIKGARTAATITTSTTNTTGNTSTGARAGANEEDSASDGTACLTKEPPASSNPETLALFREIFIKAGKGNIEAEKEAVEQANALFGRPRQAKPSHVLAHSDQHHHHHHHTYSKKKHRDNKHAEAESLSFYGFLKLMLQLAKLMAPARLVQPPTETPRGEKGAAAAASVLSAAAAQEKTPDSDIIVSRIIQWLNHLWDHHFRGSTENPTPPYLTKPFRNCLGAQSQSRDVLEVLHHFRPLLENVFSEACLSGSSMSSISFLATVGDYFGEAENGHHHHHKHRRHHTFSRAHLAPSVCGISHADVLRVAYHFADPVHQTIEFEGFCEALLWIVNRLKPFSREVVESIKDRAVDSEQEKIEEGSNPPPTTGHKRINAFDNSIDLTGCMAGRLAIVLQAIFGAVVVDGDRETWSQNGLRMRRYQRQVFDSHVTTTTTTIDDVAVPESKEGGGSPSSSDNYWSSESSTESDGFGSESSDADEDDRLGDIREDCEEGQARLADALAKAAAHVSKGDSLIASVREVHQAQIQGLRERIAKKIMDVHLAVSAMQGGGKVGEGDRDEAAGNGDAAGKSKKGKKTKSKKSKATTLSPPTSGTLLLQSLQTLLKFPDHKVEQLTEGTLLVVDRALGNIIQGKNEDKRTTRALHHLWTGPESDHSHGMTFVGDGHVRHYHHYQFKSSTEDNDDDNGQKKKKLSAEDAAKAKAEAEARAVIRFQEERLYVIRSLRAAIAHKRLVHGHTLSDIRSLFQAADTNGDGVLDCEEISDMMKHLDIPFGTSRAENDFAHVLTNGGTHRLLLAELTAIIAVHHHGRTADLIYRHESGEDLLQVTGEEALSIKRKALLAMGEVGQ